MQICSTATWVVFCIEQYEPKFYWHFVSNVGGLIVTSAIFGIYLTYCSRADRVSVLIGASVPIAIGIAWYFFSRPNDGLTEMYCFISTSVMHLGPVPAVRNALRWKSTEFLPLSLGLSSLAFALPWRRFEAEES